MSASPSPAPLRVGVYARISRDDGAAVGVRAQVDQCRREVERQAAHGLSMTVVAVYVDNDRSAFLETQRRDHYARLLADARAGRLDVVMVRSIDRLDRREARLLDVAEDLFRLGVDLWTVKAGRHDLTTAEGRHDLAQQARMAQLESERTSERILDAIDARLVEAEAEPSGWVLGPGRAYGFAPGPDGERQVVEAEAEVVREAARRLLAGETLRGIATDLNARGARTAGGRPWSRITLRQVLEAPRLTGLREHRRARRRWQRGPTREVWLQETTWPRILDRDVFDAVQAILRERKGGRIARRYPLTGLLECGRCGAPLMPHPRRDGTRVYMCKTHHDGPVVGCGHNPIRSDDLEDYLARQLADVVRRGVIARDVARQDAATRETADRIAALRARLADLGERFIRGEVAEALFDGAQRAATAELGRLQAEQAASLSSTPLAPFLAAPDTFAEAWAVADEATRQQLYRAALRPGARVVILPSDGLRKSPRRPGNGGYRRVPVADRVLTIPWRA